MDFKKQFKEGLLTKNPVLAQLLGMCSTLAITTSLFNGLGMGVAVTIILICSNVLISALRKVIPSQIRIAAYIVIIAGFVTIVDLLLQAYIPDLAESLGVFIPLIVVNCVILGRAEAFASKNGVLASAVDGLCQGIGYTVALVVMCVIRELLGSGTFGGGILGENGAGIQIFPADYAALQMIMPVGGFLTLGCLIALMQFVLRKSAEKAEANAEMNYFFGLNVAEAPGWIPSLAWIIPILAGLSQFVSVKILQGKQQQNVDPDNPTAQSMQTMNNIMPLMSAFFCITMPIGLGIYWIASSVVQIIQQVAINAYMEKIDIDEMVKKNIEKVNKKRAKQGLPPTKVSSASSTLEEVRALQEKAKKAEDEKREKTARQIEESNMLYFRNDPNPNSLASKAAMVQKYNEAHEKRNSNKNK